MSSPVIVVFHGNCTDGALAALLASQYYAAAGVLATFYPANPSDPRTFPGGGVLGWPGPSPLLLLDITPPPELMAFYKTQCSAITIIDHHPVLPEVAAGCFVVHTVERCAAYLTYTYLWPAAPIPQWLLSVDRVDRWTGVTEEDKHLREVFHPLAKLAVSHSPAMAFSELDKTIRNLIHPDFAPLIYAHGKALYDEKMAALDASLEECHHHMVEIDPEYADAWSLPIAWYGRGMYVIDTTDHKNFDTTAGSQRVFDKFPGVDIFLNYRLITWHSGSKYAFHARARDGSSINLTDCPHLNGHPCAAGGQRIVDGSIMPFVLDQEEEEDEVLDAATMTPEQLAALEASAVNGLVAMSQM